MAGPIEGVVQRVSCSELLTAYDSFLNSCLGVVEHSSDSGEELSRLRSLLSSKAMGPSLRFAVETLEATEAGGRTGAFAAAAATLSSDLVHGGYVHCASQDTQRSL